MAKTIVFFIIPWFQDSHHLPILNKDHYSFPFSYPNPFLHRQGTVSRQGGDQGSWSQNGYQMHNCTSRNYKRSSRNQLGPKTRVLLGGGWLGVGVRPILTLFDWWRVVGYLLLEECIHPPQNTSRWWRSSIPSQKMFVVLMWRKCFQLILPKKQIDSKKQIKVCFPKFTANIVLGRWFYL